MPFSRTSSSRRPPPARPSTGSCSVGRPPRWAGKGARAWWRSLAPLLDNSDADVRLDAAAALGLARARDAEGPLRARLAVETDPAVSRQIEAALKAVTATR